MSELVHACGEEPQVLYNRGKPVAAVIGIERFEAFQRMEKESEQPSMAALLAELDAINQDEDDFGVAPPRTNRPPAALD